MADPICPDSQFLGRGIYGWPPPKWTRKPWAISRPSWVSKTPALDDALQSSGVSVMLSKRLLRARKLRRLDTTRETRSLQLYHHIIWLSREGLLLLEGYILPKVDRFVELKVLAYKLRASFYHIFVLFHNRPIFIPETDVPTRLKHDSIYDADALAALGISDTYKSKMNMASPPLSRPPGLPVMQPVQLPQLPQPIPSFLLPPLDYTATATACFNHAASLSDKLLPGSHPLRLSVKLEYAAYLYDCLQDPIACFHLAKQTIADVYNSQEGMDDESFKDAAEIVSVLGKMVRRGGKSISGTGTPGSTISHGGVSRSRSSRSARHLGISVPATESTPGDGARLGVTQPVVPNAPMLNRM
ncbi:hypothetical protein PDIDSM_826 [Penicillium digitatum]|nr:hypothetical protein PDIDSM_826 [Penicillium digitatum]